MAVVPLRVVELVETFDRNIEAYRSQQYNETQLRREFIDPFFKELGWDVTNKAGWAQAYKDVIHEDAIKISGATKAPDYCFRIGGARKFFLEAKKPSVDIKGDPHPAYQLRRYAWSAKLPLSVLTDFEEFAVYDCRMRPKHTDKADVARIMLFTYKDYLKNWSEIADIFSKEAILKGSFDKFAVATKGKRGTSTVDKEFLAEIEKWRNMLARIIALRNTALSVREINFSVQRTIDRILFLRMCEDRGIEPYGQLQSIISGERTYPRLCEVFEKADQKYNSGLFHFHDEPDRSEGPDELTPNIIIDDKDLKWILHSLYYPQSPYEFSVLPAEILGNVYEQFLGKVITLTTGHRASVEDKPEVKKAGGVYYTPSYIVDYIVKNTVGRLLGDPAIPNKPLALSATEGAAEVSVPTCHSRESGNPPAGRRMTPRQVSNIKILDPACGSGSFLIGAYQYLLDWHLKHYTENDPEKYMKGKNPKIFETNSRHSEPFDFAQDKLLEESQLPHYRLTITEKKRILLNNIFGVDIDSQAVEVTKLSLLLKVLEGESSETLDNQYRLFHERALPDLANNIKCGNSLIGPDFYDNLDSSCHSRENGNPDELHDRINAFEWHVEFPKIFNCQNSGFDTVIGNPPWGSLVTPPEKQYLCRAYINRRGEAESHLFFIERALSLLNKSGVVGFITPNTWLTVLNSEEIRRHLLQNSNFYEICQLSKYIFTQAPDIVPILAFFGTAPADPTGCTVRTTKQIRVTSLDQDQQFSTEKVQQSIWATSSPSVINLYATPFVLRIVQKCTSSARSLSQICHVLYGVKTGNNKKFLSPTETDKHKSKALKTGELTRYSISWKGLYLWWCPQLAGYRSSSLEVPKIVIQYIRKLSLPRRIVAALDYDGIYYPLNNYSYIVSTEPMYSLKFVLALLNSSLMNFYFANTFIDYNIKPTYLQQLPIHTIDPKSPNEKASQNKTVKLADRMLDLHKKLAVAKVPDDKTRIQRQIDATDKQIDKLVYELYGLTEEEIKIVENSGKNNTYSRG